MVLQHLKVLYLNEDDLTAQGLNTLKIDSNLISLTSFNRHVRDEFYKAELVIFKERPNVYKTLKSRY